MSDEHARRDMLRALLVNDEDLRPSTAALCEAMLVELADLDDDDPAPEWVDEARLPGDPELTVAEARARIRVALEETSGD